MRRRTILMALGALGGHRCVSPASAGASTNATLRSRDFIARVLRGGSVRVQKVLADAAALGLQICYSRITRSGLETHYFRRDAEWFAPASLVKLPLAALLLEQLETAGVDWQRARLSFPEMPLCAERASELRTAQSIERIIERALVLSDDSAYCALFDALGPQHIARRMSEMGFAETRIQARFGQCGPTNSRVTGPVVLHPAAGAPMITPVRPAFALRYSATPIRVGEAWMQAGVRVEGAKDFSDSNSCALSSLHQMLLAIVYPQRVAFKSRFVISEKARQFILSAMRRHPAESVFSSIEEKKLSRIFFRLLGVGDGVWPADLQVHNKVGWAYGFLSDMAHLRQGKKECVLSCAMYLNADGVLNDGRYDYDAIGRPFMAEAGRLLLAAS